tara:strand:+ start:960 stop:2198 length:1239 start_codon:yes stop_codon:yes gene_type:complete
MYFVYNILGIIITLISPLIILYRISIGKEDFKRFKERYCIYKKTNTEKNLIWFHAASVGELMSIIPLIKRFENDKKIKKILLTTTTTSSANIFKKLNFKKTIHKFFPLDTNIFSKKFVEFWKPQLAIFVESEIWPMMFKNLNHMKIPIILINARITKKSYKRWNNLKKFSQDVFSKITLALPQNIESKKYLKLLGVKKIILRGNLKFFGEKNKNLNLSNIKKKLKGRNLWCAASTHYNEEVTIGHLHKKLKMKTRKLLTIIIPRHINRSNEIINNLENIDLKIHKHSSNNKISDETDIYLVDTFGEAKKFYTLSNITFMGGSLIPHGGQNPLEPARLNNFILHGPHISNFKEVYNYLNKMRMTSLFKKTSNIEKLILNKLNKKLSNTVTKKIYSIGDTILKNNLSEIYKYIK